MCLTRIPSILYHLFLLVFHNLCSCIQLVLLVSYSLKYVAVVLKKVVCTLLRLSWSCCGFGHLGCSSAILLFSERRVARIGLPWTCAKTCETGRNLEIRIVFYSCLEASDEGRDWLRRLVQWRSSLGHCSSKHARSRSWLSLLLLITVTFELLLSVTTSRGIFNQHLA